MTINIITFSCGIQQKKLKTSVDFSKDLWVYTFCHVLVPSHRNLHITGIIAIDSARPTRRASAVLLPATSLPSLLSSLES